jgi:hypothetical protein
VRSSNASPDDDKDEIYDIYGNNDSDDGNGEYYENKRILIANKDDDRKGSDVVGECYVHIYLWINVYVSMCLYIHLC